MEIKVNNIHIILTLDCGAKQPFLFSYPDPCPSNTDQENLWFRAVSNWEVSQPPDPIKLMLIK